MPSVKRPTQLAVLALCATLGPGSLAGCETTQEKASAQRAESERILDARAKRQAKRKHHHGHKHHADGTKTGSSSRNSAHRQEGKG